MSDFQSMKLTLNELYSNPTDDYTRNIYKFKLFPKLPLKEIKEKCSNNDLKFIVKYSLFNFNESKTFE